MKKEILKLGTIIILGAVLFGVTGCGEKEQDLLTEIEENKTNTTSNSSVDTTKNELANTISNESKSSMENLNLSSQEISTFNSKFEVFEGSSVRGTKIKQLLNVIQESYKEQPDKKVTITGITSSKEIDPAKTYSVKCNYDDSGYVKTIEVINN